MLKARIQAFECLDKPDFQTWVPDSPAEVFLRLTLHIGPENEEGTDMFDIVVATAQGLQGKHKSHDNRLLVVGEYNWAEIEATLTSWVESATGYSWDQIADQLRKRFRWEYEGMGPSTG